MKLRTRLASLFCAAVASLGISVSAVSGVAHADDNVFGWFVSAKTNKCVTAQFGGPGAGIVQESCGGDGQAWKYLGTPFTGNPVQIVNLNGLCMDIESFENFGRVIQVACGQQPIGSYWLVTKSGKTRSGADKLVLKSAFANFCLDLENGLPDEGLPLQVWTCNGNTDNQKWYRIFIVI